MNSADSPDSNDNDIAIVGMALRVPGARNPTEYWRNLCAGVESVRFFTDEELIAAGEAPQLLRKPNYVRAAAVLEGMEMFDGEFFGFSPKESAILDPQHRHFLECAWEALEDAGHMPDGFKGSIGLFGGCGMGSYFYFNLCSHRELVDSVGMFLLRHTGNDKDFLVTRVSYLFDLRGPAINVQTACSTSLVAAHLACQSLLNGECDMALAGGVTIEIPHGRGYLYREGEVLSPDGHCHAFDHRGQGTVFGSGVGVVVLRRLRDALADGDHVYAVIKGSAVNNDGALKVGYLAPSVDGQAAAMAEAYTIAGVDPDTIEYIECHGTGTYMGDPIEVSALTQAFRQFTERTQFCRLASVKSNIGHLDTAAGVASLIKAALAVKHGVIPPSLNFEQPNPTIDFASSPFFVNDKPYDWTKTRGPRRAGVNSLGVGGTNAHVVLEQPPPERASSAAKRPFQLITLSARTGKALDGNAQRLAQHLRETPGENLADVAFTLHAGRRGFDKRRVLAARDRDEAIRLLEQGDPRRVFTLSALDGKAQVAFMLPGGGSQYPRMGADLHDSEPVFREHVDVGLELLKKRSGLDLRPLLFAPREQLEQAFTAFEPMTRQLTGIFIVEYALAKLWMSWGVTPTALIGHSVGENTAACLAGVLSYEDALELVRLRGELFERTEPGAMLSVQLSAEELTPLLEGDVDLAVINAPQLCLASGRIAAVEALQEKLRARGIEAKRPPLPVAAHSRLLEPILGEFGRYLRSIELKAPQIPFISNRTGAFITEQQARDPEYWVQHLRSTVRFSDGIGTLLQEPNRVLLEVGPGQTLCSLARQHPNAKSTTPIIASLRHREEEVSDTAFFTTSLGRLWGAGVELPIAKLWEGETRRRLSLPTYAFAHQRYFIEPAELPRGGEQSLDHLERIDAVEDWGFRPAWIERGADARAENKPETWLLFMDDAGVGARLSRALKARGHSVTEVQDGDAFHKRGEGEYTLSPERGRTGYDALVRDLMASGRTPSRIVHLWLVTAAERFRPGSSFFHRNLEHGFYSLFFLAQALGDENVPRPLHLTVVSSGMQQVAGEPLRYPEKAAALGPCKVIPRELTGITCSSVDIELKERGTQLFEDLVSNVRRSFGQQNGHSSGGSRMQDLADQLERELLSEPSNAVIAYRDGRRWLQQYERQRLAPVAELPTVVRERGVYLITGGLGGIGLTMAEMLAERAHARLVLIARTGLPEPSDWDGWLARRGRTDAVSRKILKVRELEARGAEVMVAAADVTNLEQMRAVVDAARRRFGALNGVIHAAGLVKDALIQMKTELDVEDVFAPKVHGTLVLDALLRDLELDFFVLFSSTSAIAAPPGQIDYVAANAFLDAYARARSSAGGTRTVAINWGIWHGVGIASQAFGEEAGAVPRIERVGPAEHPLFEERLRDERGRSVLRSAYNPKMQWILDEHRTASGQALIPGTGYLELARAALEAIGEPSGFEIRDLFFIRPLAVRDDEVKEARVLLQRSEEGYAFEVRTKCQFEGRPGWELHAQGRLLLHRLTVPAAIDVAAIDRRCQRKRSPLQPEGMRSPQEAHLRFGPRWRVLQQVSYGDGEALALLQLPTAFVADLDSFKLHPALMDIATGYAMDLIAGYGGDDLWVPVSYGSVRVYGNLPRRVHSWIRIRGDNRADGDFALFDVTIADPEGRPVVEVSEFAIKRMRDHADFTAGSAPSRAEVELEPSASGERERSPAEQRLLHNYEQGIRPQEGADALLRVLAGDALPQLAVSSLDLGALVRQADQVASAGATSGTKFERPELDSDYVAPRDELERTLVGFWEELLGVDKVGVQDSFFDLGGHSLIAVRLFAMIKKAYQVEFPISVLFEAPTIERCAKLVRDVIGERSQEPGAAVKPSAAQPRSRFRHLVAMHPGEGGAKTPFFLVAGMFGNVLNLRHLAHLLGTDRPFYGLQARGLYGDEQPHETFEEMAEAYIAEMMIVQPQGPYYLGGFSGGGITAFEIAHQLRAAGHDVAALVMLDSRLPVTPPITKRDRALIQVQRLQRQGPSYLGRWARSRVQWELERLQNRFGSEEAVAPTPDQFQNDAIERAFRAALPRYHLRRYPGRISLFRPKLEKTYVLGPERFLNSEREWVYPDNGWTPWADQVDVHEVPGDHDSMVLEPNVRVLASQLRKCIETAEARTLSSVAATRPESAQSYTG
jgi:acyl transferase domain-containing protein/thioesterase domain-containing protein